MTLTRVALVGTGYIADYHAKAIKSIQGIELASVCDKSISSAQTFAAKWQVPSTFGSLEEMLESDLPVGAVHILTPPDQHHFGALAALKAGLHVFLEKPMCVTPAECDELVKLADDRKQKIAVNHNFMFSRAYGTLRAAVHSGILGRIQQFTLNYFLELPQMRFGPFDTWMLRNPGNTFLEVGPHLISALLDLVGEPEELRVTADRDIALPGGNKACRRWRINGTSGRAAIDINADFEPGFPQRTLSIRGQSGTALLDFDADTCAIDTRTSLSFDFDRFTRSRKIAKQINRDARASLSDYALTTLKLRRRGGPYQATFFGSIDAFYASILHNQPLDRRISGAFGRTVIEYCTKVVEAAGVTTVGSPKPKIRNAVTVRPTVLVFGGAGFIGRELIKQLLDANYSVRAVAHRTSSILEDIESVRLEIVRGDMRSEADLKRLLDGIEFVFHLARGHADAWEDYVKYDVEPTRLLADACREAGVKRLIYTGTIASLYTGKGAGTITEQTPVDREIKRRDYYSRAKAAAEDILREQHSKQKLPVVVFRPGIVIGPGGSPFHWGVGSWPSESICEVWGDGRNPLPFVLVRDVASGLVRGIQVPDIEGRTYNLVDHPLMNARDYLDELQRLSGTKISVNFRPIWKSYLGDLGKWVVKVAVRHPDRHRIPSYRDWESRTQRAVFDCSGARSELNWKPASDRLALISEGIGGALQGLD